MLMLRISIESQDYHRHLAGRTLADLSLERADVQKELDVVPA